MGGGLSVWSAATEEVGLRPARADFFMKRGVRTKIHPIFSLTEEAKPVGMAKPSLPPVAYMALGWNYREENLSLPIPKRFTFLRLHSILLLRVRRLLNHWTRWLNFQRRHSNGAAGVRWILFLFCRNIYFNGSGLLADKYLWTVLILLNWLR